MQARVKADHQFKIVQAHTGREYIKSEWRFAPAGDAECPFLEYRQDSKPETAPVVAEATERLGGKTKAELAEMARDADIEGFGAMNKAELVAALEGK